MKITYVESIDGTKLFSFHTYDYKTYTDKKGNFMMIDGGTEYVRYSADPEQKVSWLSESELKDVFKDIRKQFTWIQRYDKNMNPVQSKSILLKDLTTAHIAAILDTQSQLSEFTKEIFHMEFNNRIKKSNKNDTKNNKKKSS